MHSWHTTIGIVAGALAFFDFILYYISIIRGKTTPNRATWFILTIVGFLIASSYYTLGARSTIWVPLGYVVGPFIAFLLSIKFGTGGWTRFDKICLSAAFVSFIVWLISRNALLSLLINIVIDGIGLIPTIRKTYLNPRSEELTPWAITFLASALNLLAITQWRFDIWIYPVYMISINTAVLLCILRKNSKV